MLKFLADKNLIELIHLGIQAKIPQIEFLTKTELLDELEDDFYKAWDEAILSGIDLDDGLPYQGQRDNQEWMVKE